MLHINVPDCLSSLPQIVAGNISFVFYQQDGMQERIRAMFNKFALSFVLNGQKEIYRAQQNTIINNGQGMLIPVGNSIVAEHNLNDNHYCSLLVFFSPQYAVDFLQKYALSNAVNHTQNAPDYLTFCHTGLLAESIKGLQSWIERGAHISHAVALHKLEELLLMIYEMHPDQLIQVLGQEASDNRFSLRQIVESNLFNKLTIQELAFLANRSVSSFKRDFEKIYHLSPQKYIRDSKLDAACLDLMKGKLATEIYDYYGYENLSNFNTAFKKKFGISPTGYRHELKRDSV